MSNTLLALLVAAGLATPGAQAARPSPYHSGLDRVRTEKKTVRRTPPPPAAPLQRPAPPPVTTATVQPTSQTQ
ncbi:MAG: hypothetical protein KBE25_04305 [Laribacter sp.]|jgi:hypothetical protein|nr:hypothetical protein [Laribacter sp.]MBP9527228.1 hypothetical protein [Laribacter sp.]MBP9608557.1 hypothetical protein [Laribacter sp.]